MEMANNLVSAMDQNGRIVYGVTDDLREKTFYYPTKQDAMNAKELLDDRDQKATESLQGVIRSSVPQPSRYEARSVWDADDDVTFEVYDTHTKTRVKGGIYSNGEAKDLAAEMNRNQAKLPQTILQSDLLTSLQNTKASFVKAQVNPSVTGPNLAQDHSLETLTVALWTKIAITQGHRVSPVPGQNDCEIFWDDVYETYIEPRINGSQSPSNRPVTKADFNKELDQFVEYIQNHACVNKCQIVLDLYPRNVTLSIQLNQPDDQEEFDEDFLLLQQSLKAKKPHGLKTLEVIYQNKEVF